MYRQRLWEHDFKRCVASLENEYQLLGAWASSGRQKEYLWGHRVCDRFAQIKKKKDKRIGHNSEERLPHSFVINLSPRQNDKGGHFNLSYKLIFFIKNFKRENKSENKISHTS